MPKVFSLAAMKQTVFSRVSRLGCIVFLSLSCLFAVPAMGQAVTGGASGNGAVEKKEKDSITREIEVLFRLFTDMLSNKPEDLSFHAYGLLFEWKVDSYDFNVDTGEMTLNYRYQLNPNQVGGDIFFFIVKIDMKQISKFFEKVVYKTEIKASEASPAIYVQCNSGIDCYYENVVRKCNGYLTDCRDLYDEKDHKNDGFIAFWSKPEDRAYVMRLLQRMVSLLAL